MAKLTDSVNFRLTPEEKQVWLRYCDMTSRTQNDVFRDYIRVLAKKMSKKGASNPFVWPAFLSRSPSGETWGSCCLSWVDEVVRTLLTDLLAIVPGKCTVSASLILQNKNRQLPSTPMYWGSKRVRSSERNRNEKTRSQSVIVLLRRTPKLKEGVCTKRWSQAEQVVFPEDSKYC